MDRISVSKVPEENKSSTDVFIKEKRSDVMSRIRGKNTKSEMLVRMALQKKGYRY